MADEHLVLDHDTFADEAVRRDLAAGADTGVLLDLDERPDARSGADAASIKIHQGGMVDHYIGGQDDTVGYRHDRIQSNEQRDRRHGTILLPRGLSARSLRG